jgi:hypothetical protein
VNVLSTVELGRAARANTIGTQNLDSLLLNLIIAVEVVEVVGCEIGNSSAVGEFSLGTGRAIEISDADPD